MAISGTILDYLTQKQADYGTVSHPMTYSSSATASAAHVDDDHIAKAVILKDGAGYLVTVIPAGHWLDLNRLRSELGRELQLAKEDEANRVFKDCRPGAFPPLGGAYGVETLLDESLTSLAKIYFEAGDHEHLIVVDNEQFLRLMQGARRGYFSRSE